MSASIYANWVSTNLPSWATLRAAAAWTVQSGIEACLLAACVVIAQRLLQGRISARWRYNLWLLVAVRLLLPGLPASRLSPFNLVPRFRADEAKPTVAPARVALAVIRPDFKNLERRHLLPPSASAP